MGEVGREVTIPYWPRKWAEKFHSAPQRWAALVLHRRAGKTTAVLAHHVMAALDNAWETERLKKLVPKADVRQLLHKRTYWHVMPSYRQGKLTGAWDTLKELVGAIPEVRKNESEMLIELPNSNRVQVIGADKPDSLRGPGLSGLSLDEFSQIHPRAFSEVLSKALADHLGYCVFSGTIQGTDQLYETYEAAKISPEWFALWQGIDISLETEEGATIETLRRAMEDDRKLVLQGLMSQGEYDQEWYLSPDAAVKGAIYGKELGQAQTEGRITNIPIDPAVSVDTDWDLGIGDSMAIWFSQSLRTGEVRLVDYYEASGEGFPFYVQMLKAKGYTYGKHWAPHDISVRELGSGKSRLEVARALGLAFEVTPRLQQTASGEIEEGIHAVRLLLSRCWFDSTRCKAGLEALRHYRRDYNQRLDEFKATPVHDWACHASDAFRGLAVRHEVPRETKRKALAETPRDWAWS